MAIVDDDRQFRHRTVFLVGDSVAAGIVRPSSGASSSSSPSSGLLKSFLEKELGEGWRVDARLAKAGATIKSTEEDFASYNLACLDVTSSVVVLLVGSNDCSNKYLPVADILGGLTRLTATLSTHLGSHRRVLLCTLPQTSNRSPYHRTAVRLLWEGRRAKINEWILREGRQTGPGTTTTMTTAAEAAVQQLPLAEGAEAAKEEEPTVANEGQSTFIPLDAEWDGCLSQLVPHTPLWSCDDGMHPSSAGYEALAAVLALAILTAVDSGDYSSLWKTGHP